MTVGVPSPDDLAGGARGRRASLGVAARAFAALATLVALCGCSADDAVGVEDVYPAGPYAWEPGRVVPNLAFEGVLGDGTPGTVRLGDFHAPGRDGLLVVAVSGGLWCGTCRWPARAWPDALAGDARVARLDLVVGDRDNAPADGAAAAAWRRSFPALDTVPVGADPDYRLRAVVGDAPSRLPLFVLIDTRTMTVADAVAAPSPAELEQRVNDALGDEAPAVAEPLVDGFFRPHEWALLQETTWPSAPPPDRSNAVADSPPAAALGRALFFDADLSPSGDVSCATCHRPDAFLTDGRPRAHGVAEGDRRTPAIALSAHTRWQYWDGRADSGWAQALGPLENEREIDSSRVFVARRVLSAHRDAYRAAFPDSATPDTTGWPLDGKPGELAYESMTAADREAVTQIFVHAGKAIAAWERTLRVSHNPLDAYVAGDFGALDGEQKYGLQVFVRHGCMQCHWGPRLSDDAFHNLRVSTGRRDGLADRGRIDGLAAWRDSEFRRDGRWSDEPLEMTDVEPTAALLGQFKTPPLRGVADLAFFGHGGTFEHLAEVTEFYGWGDAEDDDSTGRREPWLVPFGETVQWGLVPFLAILSAAPAVR